MKSFEIDVYGPIFTYGNRIFNVIFLSLMWSFLTLFSFGLLLPIATVALVYASYEGVVGSGSAVRNFFSIFKRLKGSFTTYYLMPLGLVFLFLISVYNFFLIMSQASNAVWLLPINVLVAYEALVILIYVIPLILTYKLKVRYALKYAFALGNIHFFTSFTCVALLLAVSLATVKYSFFPLTFAPSIVAALNGYLVFSKILPKYNFSNFGERIYYGLSNEPVEDEMVTGDAIEVPDEDDENISSEQLELSDIASENAENFSEENTLENSMENDSDND